eukprot:jgi/Undpi1/12364/HiC_scaffold_5.g02036.m1
MDMSMDDDMSMSSMSMDMDMNMNFVFSCDVGPLLFSWWTISSCSSLYLSCIPIVFLGLARHWVFHLVAGGKPKARSDSTSRTTALLDPNGLEASSSSTQKEYVGLVPRLIWTLLSTLGAALSLLSMLVVMTYSVELFIAVLVGEFIGFWIWGTHALPEAMRGCH